MSKKNITKTGYLNATKQHEKIPTGKLARSGIVGLTTATIGAKKLAFMAKKPFISESEKIKQSELNDQEIAELIFSKMGYLKGTFLKIAQAASLEVEFLPKKIRKELLKSTNEVPPINKALIRKVIKSELGDFPEKLFKKFESNPFAAASLGQVHLAETFEGESVAVKIQYPGISSSIRSDLSIAKMLMKPLRLPSFIDSLFLQIEDKLAEEIDYEQEVKNTIWFHENLTITGVYTPKVFTEFSSKKVITTEFIKGIKLDEWMATKPEQSEINNIGQKLVDIFETSIHDLKCIHCDPNLGNYLVQEDSTLCLIDFGCITPLQTSLVKGIKIAITASPDKKDDPKFFKKIYEKIEIEFKEDFYNPELFEDIQTWYQWISRPYQTPTINFMEEDTYMSEFSEAMHAFTKNLSKPHKSMVYFGRANHGLFRLLQLLGAEVSFQHHHT